jgi:hypothetical protein
MSEASESKKGLFSLRFISIADFVRRRSQDAGKDAPGCRRNGAGRLSFVALFAAFIAARNRAPRFVAETGRLLAPTQRTRGCA